VSRQAVLSQRALNRALLSRQLLLDRVELPDEAGRRRAAVIAAIEHLVGLQAQAPFPPYYGLWSRLGGFRPDDLAAAITDRSAVRIAVMRGTIHVVSARDCLPLRRLIQPVLDRGLRGSFGKQLAGVDATAVAAAGRELVESEPMTFSALGQALAERWPDHPPAALAQAVRAHVPLVQVPPRAVWGRAGQSLHTSAEHWLGPAAAADPALPPTLAATARDVTAWSGLTGLRAVIDELRPSLVTFRDEQGAELFDLPSAPRPGEDVPAPVRLAAEFDNLLLSHADRSRIVHLDHLKRFYRTNAIFPGSVLIDGFVAGMWRLARTKSAATLTIELFEPFRARRHRRPGQQRAQVGREAEHMLAFCAPGATHDVRFAPVA
jgi:hypothetical protein